jgi:hypothetical protein
MIWRTTKNDPYIPHSLSIIRSIVHRPIVRYISYWMLQSAEGGLVRNQRDRRDLQVVGAVGAVSSISLVGRCSTRRAFTRFAAILLLCACFFSNSESLPDLVNIPLHR